MEKSELLDILIDKIKKDYSNDISIVYIYGSYLRNDYHSLSDIDLFLVKKTENGQKLSLTFILNGIGYDFWTVSWDWIEKVAKYETRTPSLITEGKVLYSSSEEDLKRFNELIDMALKIDNDIYLNKAKEKINEIYKTAFMINYLEDLSKVREEIIGFIYEICEAISLMNCKNLRHQRKYFKDEIMKMENVPKNFEKHYEILFTSNEINELRTVVNYLFVETKEMLEKRTKNMEKSTFKDIFSGWYEEMVQHYNKIYYSCDTNDYHNAFFSTIELINALKNSINKIGIITDLPNIVDAYNFNNCIFCV
jgi:predicted nucleotidyltransferase